jgi:TatD DNase family protein
MVMNITVFSYAGQMFFGMIAGYEAMPHLPELRNYILEALEALEHEVEAVLSAARMWIRRQRAGPPAAIAGRWRASPGRRGARQKKARAVKKPPARKPAAEGPKGRGRQAPARNPPPGRLSPPRADAGFLSLVDIGVNLAHDSFDADRDEVLARARQAGVARMVVTGSSPAPPARRRCARAKDPGLFATVGVHPHHADELDAGLMPRFAPLQRTRALSPSASAGWISFATSRRGTAGVRLPPPAGARDGDRAPGFPAPARRARAIPCHPRRVRRAQACWRRALLHRRADGEMKAYLDRGLYIGVTGWLCDERRGDALREAVRYLPLDRVMIETDAPYLLPRDLEPRPRSRRNEPMHLPHVLAGAGAMDGTTRRSGCGAHDPQCGGAVPSLGLSPVAARATWRTGSSTMQALIDAGMESPHE